ncbi:FAD-binding protein, partial [Terriglobus sp. YAF25]|uniref:FAD-binding protein n=1 Tax=Terriglobus sp. YAF25 TaxID=3233080 RepID=UPI003F9C9922
HTPADYVKRKLPSMDHQFLELADVDITREPMEVGPTCHYMMGGIRVDAETAQTSIPGLFAAGEAAAGLHGANRLGGNSLSDLLVFGRRAGLAAAEHARRSETLTIDSSHIEESVQQMLAPFERLDGESPYAIHSDLQATMQSLVGIFRCEEDLRRALSEIETLKERTARVRVEGSRLFNPGWHLVWDLHSMLTIAEGVTRSALARRESRGAHSRIDYPALDDTWGKKHNVVVKNAGTMTLVDAPVLEMPDDLKQLLAEDSGAK